MRAKGCEIHVATADDAVEFGLMFRDVAKPEDVEAQGHLHAQFERLKDLMWSKGAERTCKDVVETFGLPAKGMEARKQYDYLWDALGISAIRFSAGPPIYGITQVCQLVLTGNPSSPRVYGLFRRAAP